MDRNDVKKIVVEAISQIQEISGRATPDLENETLSIKNIEGFDSVNCVELACEVSSSVGFEVDAKLFIPNVLGQPMTIGEAIDRLWSLCKTQTKEAKSG